MSMTSMKKLLVLVVLLGVASIALAIPPTWMPGFPMRMGTNVMLMWTPVPGATAYNVYKSGKDGDIGQKIISSPMNNHMDMNIPVDQSAFYTIKAVVGGAEAPDSSMVGKILGAKPLVATKWLGHMDAEGQVSLRFENVEGAAFYNVFRAEAEAGPFKLMASVQESKYTDTTIEVGKEYFYQVTAVDKNSMESPKSASYKYIKEKQVEAVQAKTWKQVDKLVTFSNEFTGPEARLLLNPAWLATDGSYLIASDNRGVAIFDEAGELVRDLRPPANYEGPWGQVRGIAASATGNILITYMSPAVIRFMDPNDGALVKEIKVETPANAPEEYLPRGITEDGAGNIWVGMPIVGQIYVYDANGELIKKIGESSDGKRLMGAISLLMYHKPTNRVYVTDPMVKYIRAFDAATMDWINGPDGKPFYGWYRPGGGVGSVQEIRGIATMPDGSILLSDGIDRRQQVFTPDMDYLANLVEKAGDKAPASIYGGISSVVIGNKLYLAEPLANRVSILELGK